MSGIDEGWRRGSQGWGKSKRRCYSSALMGTVAKGTALSPVLAATGLVIRQLWCLRGPGQGPSGPETRSCSVTGRFGCNDSMRQEDARPPLGAGEWC